MLYCKLTEGSTIQTDETSHNLGRCCGLRYQKRTDSKMSQRGSKLGILECEQSKTCSHLFKVLTEVSCVQ